MDRGGLAVRAPNFVDVVVVVIVVVVVVVLLKFLILDAGIVFVVRWFWFVWGMVAFRPPHVVVKVRYVDESDCSIEWICVWVFRKVFEEPGVLVLVLVLVRMAGGEPDCVRNPSLNYLPFTG